MISVDSKFSDPRLAALYDRGEGRRPDLVHYARLVRELGATSVLDVGCGTGTFACELARAGIDVVGLDPAAASLEIARQKPDADRVRWLLGDATTLPAMAVDMAVMTGNVAQVFLTETEWMATLRGIHAALGQDGWLVFETRDPAYRGWEEWTPALTRSRTQTPDGEEVESWCSVVEAAMPLVSFRWMYHFLDQDEVLHSDSTLVFRERDEIAATLDAAGFQLREVRDAPDRPDKEFVFLAQRSG